MRSQRVNRQYGTWPSAVTVTTILDHTVIIDGPRSDGDRPYWGQVRFDEGGRCGIWTVQDDAPVRLTAADEDVRSTVYEYGGGAWNVDAGVLAYVDHGAQSVMVREAGRVRTVATLPDSTRVGDLDVNARQRCIVAVREEHRGEWTEPRHSIIRLPLDEPKPTTVGDGHVLVAGRDFYASPRLCDSGQLAWVEWDHPEMAWTRTQIRSGQIDNLAESATLVAGECGESALYPTWTREADGGWTLLLCSDRSGYWNLYRWDSSSLVPLAPVEADLAGAPWALGGQPFAPRADGSVVCAWYTHGSRILGTILPDGERVPWQEVSDVGRIAAGSDWVAAEVATVESASAVLLGSAPDPAAQPEWRRAGDVPAPLLPSESISRPRPFTWRGAAGLVHGWYYPPTSQAYCGPPDTRPPLLVLLHGGPTGMAHSSYALDRQIWTTRGFAVLDVNYSGSTGFGRDYRRRLDGRWGELDVSDCVRGAEEVVAAGLADPDAVLIRGASAGGYTALRAAATSDVFAAAVSIYGVTDVVAMARDTHKLESRYIGRLVGERPNHSVAVQSNVPDLAGIQCPILLLHGSDDRVVPVSQAKLLARSLRERGVPVELIVFEGEAHGFRYTETLQQAFSAELEFYQRVLHRAVVGERR